MASEAGWGRLAADIQAKGYDVRVDASPYVQERYGRIERGVSRSITFRVMAGDVFLGVVHVGDKHGRMGKWYGWTVTTEGADSITIGRPTYAVTNRSEVASHFAAAVATLTGRSA